MQLLATYTFGQALLTVLELGRALPVDLDRHHRRHGIFRSHDLSGWAKAGWLALIVLVPLLGVLINVIARNDTMKAHQVSDERQQEVALIAEVEDMKNRGILTDEEFQRINSQRTLTQKARRHLTTTSLDWSP
jgi:hypothetical protein